jgi:hypothetical protein
MNEQLLLFTDSRPQIFSQKPLSKLDVSSAPDIA